MKKLFCLVLAGLLAVGSCFAEDFHVYNDMTKESNNPYAIDKGELGDKTYSDVYLEYKDWKKRQKEAAGGREVPVASFDLWLKIKYGVSTSDLQVVIYEKSF